MHTIQIKLAGLPIRIETVTDCLSAVCGDYLTDEAPCFTVTTTEADILAEREKSMAEHAYEGLVYPDFSPVELENTAVYRKIAMRLPEYNAIVFHGAAVAVGEQAFLFTAKSGTGKTTHTNLWLKNIDGSYIVNGDKPILRVTDGKVFVCGTPWMGKEALGCNTCVPLQGLCILRRGTENTIQPVRFSDVMPTLVGQSYRPPDNAALIRTLRVIEQIGQTVGLYVLYCNMEDEAALVAYKEMCK